MSLPAREQRALSEIEADLRGCSSRLVSMFAIFTRLTIDDGAPRTELLQPVPFGRRIWRRSRLAAELALAVPLALGIVALITFLAVSSAGVHGCRPEAGGPYVTVSGAALASCQSQAGLKP